AVASRDIARGKGGVDDRDADRAIRSGAAAWKFFDQNEADNRVQERRARRELLTASVGQRWDGGDRSAIAPMKVYTPTRGQRGRSRATASSPHRSPVKASPNAKVWNAAVPARTTPEDRYI
ncbi:hypothetical protein R3P93_24525, partial [Rhodococcus cerastii]|nr:hypothetical protein [Rhodococcus cerastii]